MQRKRAEAATTRAFLFSDLRDYTSFVEAKGDAAAARLLRDYRTLVRREAARHDGAEVKTEASARSHVAAVRAIFAGDTAAAARHLDAAWSAFEHVGFAGMYVRTIITMLTVATVRGLRVGAERASVVARARAFAERARAQWWLAVLDRSEL